MKLVCVTILLTLAATLLVLNLTSGEKRLDEQIKREYAMHDAQYQRTLGVMLGSPITEGNRFEALFNGDQIFPPMLAAIRSARTTITFETYIYWSGEIGQAFAAALAERARNGVKVHVLLDWVGSGKMEQRFIQEMEDAGVQVRKFHKPSFYDLSRMNNRTHRKLLIVDGRVGFTGGVGIATEWTGNAQDPKHWRDSHFKVEGPVVAQMQSVFMDNWIKASGDVLHGEAYFPAIAALSVSQGQGKAQTFSSSPSGGSESVHLMYLLSIAAAARTIDLSSAYFVPDDLTVGALVAALRRGVRVRIITPGPIIDSQTVRAASRSAWGPLLEAGAQIHEYQPTMFHVKVFTVDDLLVSVGSTNFDNRSFKLNDEANLNIYDEAFARAQTQQFEKDLSVSKRITFEQWRDRPIWEKVTERFAALVYNQL
ncbi:phosphatidylserine/phosphatidylglycerophosphate/cardiolipin synthase family protein [Variovorax sp. KK3]|uniref:phospholipase D-like domain-containing protein n=1 Tax=Variovorax sp. KK3 TaxID=1855728 RepID=UPI00097CAB3E|nr:phospholipase D-like domain-containing protein [Variovorax sp. KK3]